MSRVKTCASAHFRQRSESCARGLERCEGIYRSTPAEKCERRTVLPRRRSRFAPSKLGAILRWVRVAVGGSAIVGTAASSDLKKSQAARQHFGARGCHLTVKENLPLTEIRRPLRSSVSNSKLPVTSAPLSWFSLGEGDQVQKSGCVQLGGQHRISHVSIYTDRWRCPDV